MARSTGHLATIAPAPVSNGRRGRPTASRARAIDESIRAAAKAIFLEIGFEAATMDAIALRAPVSKGTLYARYASKELLFRALVEGEIEHLSAEATDLETQAPGMLAPLLRHHVGILTQVIQLPRFQVLAGLLAAARGAFPDLDRMWEHLAIGRYRRFIAGQIAKAMDARHLGEGDCTFYADLLVHAISGWFEASRVRADAEAGELQAFADRVIATILCAVTAAAGPNDPSQGASQLP